MGNFHVYHISFFDSLIGGLKNNGVALKSLTYQSYINRFDINNPVTYLPLEVAYEFMNKVKKKEAVDCIASEYYGGFSLSDLSEYGEFLASCPDLLSILVNGIKYETLIMTNGKMYLETEGAISTYSMIHLDKPSQGRNISERINLAMILKAFQFVLGSNWSPIAIRITDADGSWLHNILPSSGFKLYTNSQDIAIIFKTSELTRKNKYYKDPPDLSLHRSTDPEVLVSKVLSGLNFGYIPTMEEFSGYFGYSSRTLIRSLAKAGSSYKQILEKHLFLRSIELLDDPNLTVEEISMLLGYAHPSNFIRAFRRWTSTTPSKYRIQLAVL